MNADKLLAIIAKYKADIRIEPKRDRDATERLDRIAHARWMLDEMEVMVKEETADGFEKANRWLGFVQGVLWCTEVYEIDDMREHNRSDG